ncbi:CTNS domain-containing protein [Schizosaccharomyces japonicus yFS275]|uniref:CTNS domain-containing protein n=1 Tax=Schizosaccharomyces japonicus (strain yFS275 / FY16936) TaxID=402676 RepID=B6K8F2_SCHJY|nr:CTNS domain-containing protein [Schizosaccharomyces japonicus yFS275]EEB09806.1 CTNS domain-containing protein [Schizosaccharomyces japonicus yFS275]
MFSENGQFSVFEEEPFCPSSSFTSFISACALIIGMFYSYMLQVSRIIRLGSSRGLSFTYLTLGFLGVVHTLDNIVTLEVGPLRYCCTHEYDHFQCIANSVGIIQVAVQVFSISCIVFSYWMFLPRPIHFVSAATEDGFPVAQPLSITKSKLWRQVTFVLVLNVIWALSSFLVSLTVLRGNIAWASVLGTTASLFAVIQYVPQIVQVFIQKSHGALSIPMMLVQTPGGFLITYIISQLPGTNWSSYIMYLISASLQGTLLMLCLYYVRQERHFGYSQLNQDAIEAETEREAVETLEAETRTAS